MRRQKGNESQQAREFLPPTLPIFQGRDPPSFGTCLHTRPIHDIKRVLTVTIDDSAACRTCARRKKGSESARPPCLPALASLGASVPRRLHHRPPATMSHGAQANKS